MNIQDFLKTYYHIEKEPEERKKSLECEDIAVAPKVECKNPKPRVKKSVKEMIDELPVEKPVLVRQKKVGGGVSRGRGIQKKVNVVKEVYPEDKKKKKPKPKKPLDFKHMNVSEEEYLNSKNGVNEDDEDVIRRDLYN